MNGFIVMMAWLATLYLIYLIVNEIMGEDDDAD